MNESDMVPRIYMTNELNESGASTPNHYATTSHYALQLGPITDHSLVAAGQSMSPADAMETIAANLRSFGLRGYAAGEYFHGDGTVGPVGLIAAYQRLALVLPWLRNVLMWVNLVKIEIIDDIYFYHAPRAGSNDCSK